MTDKYYRTRPVLFKAESSFGKDNDAFTIDLPDYTKPVLFKADIHRSYLPGQAITVDDLRLCPLCRAYLDGSYEVNRRIYARKRLKQSVTKILKILHGVVL